MNIDQSLRQLVSVKTSYVNTFIDDNDSSSTFSTNESSETSSPLASQATSSDEHEPEEDCVALSELRV